MSHVMIDIETAGHEDDALVVSLGAVTFDPFSNDLGNEFIAYFDVLDSEAKGGTINISTMKWWMQQNPEVCRKQFGGTEGLKRGLARFHAWYWEQKAERVWAHGTTFDTVIMKNAFKSVGLSTPWHFRDIRDMRWFQDFTADSFTLPAAALYRANAAAHDALADAKMQARVVQLAYQYLNLEPPLDKPE